MATKKKKPNAVRRKKKTPEEKKNIERSSWVRRTGDALWALRMFVALFGDWWPDT